MKIAPHFYENHATLLWFAREVPGYGIATLFAKCAAILQTRRIFAAEGATAIQQKAPQPLDCGALQDTATLGLWRFTRRCDGALQHGHQSAALLVGEKQCTCRHVFKCRCAMFVAFVLTRTVSLKIHTCS